MFKKIKAYGVRVVGLVGMFVLGLMAIAQNAKAAADPILTNLTASSTTYLSDNLSVIMDFIVLNFFKITGAGLGILALYWISRKIYSLFRK